MILGTFVGAVIAFAMVLCVCGCDNDCFERLLGFVLRFLLRFVVAGCVAIFVRLRQGSDSIVAGSSKYLLRGPRDAIRLDLRRGGWDKDMLEIDGMKQFSKYIKHSN